MANDLHQKAKSRLAHEHGGVRVNRAAPVRFALCFPNTYSVGMASLGFQLVHEMLNDLPDASCERTFLPDSDDIPEHVRSRTPIFTIESLSPLQEFDVVGFSVSFEMDYLNVLKMLELANLPLESSARDESHPLMIAGGPCSTFNPEPLADFVDAFVVGDAEDVLPQFVQAVKSTQGASRKETLAKLAMIPGIYVPQFYKPEYDAAGGLVRISKSGKAQDKAVRAVAANLAHYSAGSTIRTAEAEFGDIKLVEMTRGCGRQCRFCAAGYTTRPPRHRRIGDVPESARLGLVGAAVFDHPEAQQICEDITSAGGEFTVSSVRLETVTPTLAKLMAAGGQKTLTIAPEAGSERLRKVINKLASDEAVFAAVSAAAEAGISRVKLYFMIGLPTETDEDVQGIVDLANELTRRFPSIAFHVSASSFVPKPWTPFQWHPMETESVLKRRYEKLRRGISTIRGVKFSGESPRLAAVQGYLARGDRRLGKVLLAALGNGGDYAAALRATSTDVGHHLYRVRHKEEVLPWDVIDMRVSKTYLWKEYQKALNGEVTAACNTAKCKACGACG